MTTIKLLQVTLDDLNELVKETVKSSIISYTHELNPYKNDALLTRQETADLLRINLSTLWSWTKKGYLKSYSNGGNKVYYKREEIEKSLTRIY